MRGVNLLPVEIRKKKELKAKRQIIVTLSSVLILLLGGSYLGLTISLNSYQRKIREKKSMIRVQKSKVGRLQEALDRMERMGAQIEKVEKRTKAITELSGGGILSWRVLWELGRIIPDEVWLREVVFNPGDKKLLLQGSAFSEALVVRFLAAMESSPYFTRIDLSSTAKNPDGDYKDFEIFCIPKEHKE